MPRQPPGDRSVILACSVRSLRHYVLEAECTCGRSVKLPLNLTVASGLGGLTIADLVVQLRCKECGNPPAKAVLKENSTAGVPGMMGPRSRGAGTGWVVPLVGQEA